MHRGVVAAVVLAVAFLFLAAEGRLSLFQAGVTIVDQDLTTPSNKRTYNATIYYQDDDGLSSPGPNPTQRMRTDVFLASSGQTLTFLDIYEQVGENKSILQTTSNFASKLSLKIWAEYTLCSGGCNYQDIFPNQLPRLWVNVNATGISISSTEYKWYFNHTDGTPYVTLTTVKTTGVPVRYVYRICFNS